jgi:methyl-accepting chemotaxis protein
MHPCFRGDAGHETQNKDYSQFGIDDIDVLCVARDYRILCLGRISEDLSGEKAQAIAESMLVHIDPVKFRELVDTKDDSLPYYKKLQGLMQKTRESTRCTYLYTLVKVDEQTYMYIVDGNDPDDDDFSPLGSTDTADNYSGNEVIAFEKGISSYSRVYDTEDWGALLSAFVPIKDAEGRVLGVVGCDASAAAVAKRAARLRLLLSGLVLLLIIVAIGINYFSICHYFSAPVDRLMKRIGHLQQGDMTVEFPDTIKNEVGTIYRALGDVTGRLREVLSALTMAIDQLASTAVEISSTSDSFADNSQTQAAATEQVTATIEQFSANIDMISGHAETQTARISELLVNMRELSQVIRRNRRGHCRHTGADRRNPATGT